VHDIDLQPPLYSRQLHALASPRISGLQGLFGIGSYTRLSRVSIADGLGEDARTR